MNLQYDETLSNIAFNLKLRRYVEAQKLASELGDLGPITEAQVTAWQGAGGVLHCCAQALDPRCFESTNRVCASV